MKPYTLYTDASGKQYRLFPNFGVCQIRLAHNKPWSDEITAEAGIALFQNHRIAEVK